MWKAVWAMSLFLHCIVQNQKSWSCWYQHRQNNSIWYSSLIFFLLSEYISFITIYPTLVEMIKEYRFEKAFLNNRKILKEPIPSIISIAGIFSSILFPSTVCAYLSLYQVAYCHTFILLFILFFSMVYCHTYYFSVSGQDSDKKCQIQIQDGSNNTAGAKSPSWSRAKCTAWEEPHCLQEIYFSNAWWAQQDNKIFKVVFCWVFEIRPSLTSIERMYNVHNQGRLWFPSSSAGPPTTSSAFSTPSFFTTSKVANISKLVIWTLINRISEWALILTTLFCSTPLEFFYTLGKIK